MTENQSLLALAVCGVVSGAVWAFKFSKLSNDDSAGWMLGIGAGMGGGAIVTAIIGFVMGLFIRLPDTPGNPGFFRGFVMIVLGFLIGGFSGILGGILGGVIGQRVRR